MLRPILLALSHRPALAQAALRYTPVRRAALRFVAGERLDEALAAARALNAGGLSATLDHLGEHTTTGAVAEASAAAYEEILAAIRRAGVDSNLSLKLTQLGLDFDPALCERLLTRILDAAGDMFVRIDMESSAYTEATLRLFGGLWAAGRRNVGVVIQACLRRSADDAEQMIRLGARVRLVKGAYAEPPSIAFPRKRDVDAAFARLADRLLADGAYPAIATHDERLIDAARRAAAAHGRGPDAFEFQMLYGIRRDLQARLRLDGYRMRIYVPFGEAWYPYFVRRLAERPANLAFVVRSVLRERGARQGGASGAA